jgi:hypothetical protein
MSPATRGRVTAAVLAAALLGAPAATPATAASQPSVSLSVRYDNGAGRVREGRLTCTASGQRATGALAGRVRATRQCSRVRSIASLLTHAAPTGRLCTQIYGGPQTIRVTGRIGKARVRRTFKRTNGCEIADFARVARALPIVP